MIHKWHDTYLDLPLDDYILTFDDGLVSQYIAIPSIIKRFPSIEIHYYFSTGILRDNDDCITFNDAPIAHSLFKSNGISSDYISYNELYELSKLSNVQIGLHGHDHIHPNSQTLPDEKLHDKVLRWKSDIMKMKAFYTLNKSLFSTLIYCTPYNEYCDLQIGFLKKYLPGIKIIGPGRVNVETLSKPM